MFEPHSFRSEDLESDPILNADDNFHRKSETMLVSVSISGAKILSEKCFQKFDELSVRESELSNFEEDLNLYIDFYNTQQETSPSWRPWTAIVTILSLVTALLTLLCVVCAILFL